jgi:hypothetical protein
LIREWARKHGYSRGGEGGWRAHSALFFVYVYFVMVTEILKKQGFIDALETLPENVPMVTWDRMFYEGELNEQLLIVTDEILDRYFSDSKVDEAVSLDVRKFLKSHETLTRYKSILLRLIELVVFSKRNQSFVDQLDMLLRSE